MDWDHLRYFHAVASTGNIQRAARKLGVNHTTVFRRINRLEAMLQTRLFDRLAEGYVPTAAGERLVAHADRVSDEFDLLQLQLSGQDLNPDGTVRLTAPDNLAYEYLPRYLLDFAAVYPDIRIELVVGAERLSLSRRETDVAVRATISPPEHLVGRKCASCPWAFHAAPAYLRRYGTPARQSELSTHRIIGADGELARMPPLRLVEATLGEAVTVRCSTLNAMSAMAAAGHGVTLLPDDQRKPSLKRLFPCEPAFASDIWLLTHPELRRVQRVRLLMNHLHEAFGDDTRLSGGA